MRDLEYTVNRYVRGLLLICMTDLRARDTRIRMICIFCRYLPRFIVDCSALSKCLQTSENNTYTSCTPNCILCLEEVNKLSYSWFYSSDAGHCR